MQKLSKSLALLGIGVMAITYVLVRPGGLADSASKPAATIDSAPAPIAPIAALPAQTPIAPSAPAMPEGEFAPSDTDIDPGQMVSEAQVAAEVAAAAAAAAATAPPPQSEPPIMPSTAPGN